MHIFNLQGSHWCYPNCLRLVLGQSRAFTLPKLCVICSRTKFSGKISQNRTTEFTPGYAGNIDRDGERLSHRVCCDSLCNFLPSFNLTMALWHLATPVSSFQALQHPTTFHPVTAIAFKLHHITIRMTPQLYTPILKVIQQRAVYGVTGHTITIVTRMTNTGVATDSVFAV